MGVFAGRRPDRSALCVCLRSGRISGNIYLQYLGDLRPALADVLEHRFLIAVRMLSSIGVGEPLAAAVVCFADGRPRIPEFPFTRLNARPEPVSNPHHAVEGIGSMGATGGANIDRGANMHIRNGPARFRQDLLRCLHAGGIPGFAGTVGGWLGPRTDVAC